MKGFRRSSRWCRTCHAGALLGGNFYQKMAWAKPFPAVGRPGTGEAHERATPTGRVQVPSLRNIEKTAPTSTTADARPGSGRERHGEYQLGRPLTAEETKQITDFLKCSPARSTRSSSSRRLLREHRETPNRTSGSRQA